jgi:soluble lytic murein transglycosylase-like protein
MTLPQLLLQARRSLSASASVFTRDVGRGLLEVSHNTLALVGLAAVALMVFAASHADLRQQAETTALQWLQGRHEEREEAAGNLLASVAEPDAVNRATAANIKDLPQQQARLASWIARRYKVAPEPVSALVQEAYGIGQRGGLEPTLILAIMAVESSFNPFAQSHVGAQGLMQVMTHVHDDKYGAFGGKHAAFDPITNLRVGVQVLKDCIQRGGGVEAGLRLYVGAALLEGDGGYASRVLAEQVHMRQVASGKTVPTTVSNQATSTPIPPPATQPAKPPAASDEQLALFR